MDLRDCTHKNGIKYLMKILLINQPGYLTERNSETTDLFRSEFYKKKTCMKSKISHLNDENFTFQMLFPFVCSIVGNFQIIQDKKNHPSIAPT